MSELTGQYKDIIYKYSDKIPVPHAFLTRHGGVSQGEYSSLNLSSSRNDSKENVKENFARVCEMFGVGINDAAVTNQRHTNIVKCVSKEDRHICLRDEEKISDGLVTNTPGLPLFIFTADCIPMLMYDPMAKVIAALHLGWRSSVKDIINNALILMNRLGSKPENIRAAMGPGLKKCCFESDKDVPESIDRYLGEHYDSAYTLREDGKYMVDLYEANRIRLIQLGVRESNIDISEDCTYCRHNDYFSHRYTNGRRGNQGSVIMLQQ